MGHMNRPVTKGSRTHECAFEGRVGVAYNYFEEKNSPIAFQSRQESDPSSLSLKHAHTNTHT